MSALELKDITQQFGGLTAVSKVSVTIPKDSIFSVIGPNGAGKTTIFNIITGIYEPTAGKVSFFGGDLSLVLTTKKVLSFTLLSVLAGFLCLTLLNAEILWEQTISSLYVYQQPFPWIKAFSSFLKTLGGLSLMPFWSGAIITFLGCYTLWSRNRRSPEVVARRGIARTFQNVRLFEGLSALENVLVGMDSALKAGFLQSAFRSPSYFREQRLAEEKAGELLKFVGLGAHALTRASNLSYGHQRRLEIARALASQPRMLLLDEPAAGMNPVESAELVQLIRLIREKGITVVLIEHDMKVVMNISDRICVLDHGIKIAEGTPLEVRSDPRVIEAYLGRSHE